MKSKKATRRALFSSVMALILCCAMLVGSTFAWFTDSVTSTNNIIKSGNLDVTLDYYDEASGTFKPVETTTKVFDDSALWEPGYTQVAYLKVGNAGTLALKYQLNATVAKETEGTNAAGETFNLSDYLVFKVIEIDEATVGTYTRETAKAAAGSELGLKSYNGEYKVLEKTGDAHYVALVIYMPETVGNEANYGEKAPSIELGVSLFATQKDYENDSFGPDYDEGLEPGAVYVWTAEDLKNALKAGGNVILMDDITLESGIAPASGTVLNLNGHTITDSSTGGRTLGIQKGASVTINGDGGITKDPSVSSTYAMPLYISDGTLTVNGGTYNMGAPSGVDYSILLQNSSKVIINDGVFTNTANYPLFYAIYSSELIINGGHFESIGAENPDLLDLEYHTTRISTITIKGGVFVNYDPSRDNEGDRVVVADGYKVVPVTQANDDVWYYVVEEDAQVVSNGVIKVGDSEYRILNTDGLLWFAGEVNKYSNYEYPFEGQTVKLMDDIDLGGMEWTPIGDYRFSANRFCGTFDGQGHTISNFKITKETDKNDDGKSSYGFFGNMEGTVKNLTIDNATVDSYAYVGALVGRMNGGTLENCHVKNSSVACSYWQGGGMVGQLNDGCTVKDCTITNTTVTGASAMGGMFGPLTATNEEGKVKDILFENCKVIDCVVVKEGGFGGSYDSLFGAMFADIDVADNETHINGCAVENTTVKEEKTTALYNTLSGTKVYIDGSLVVLP